jgi:hypothetical protein
LSTITLLRFLETTWPDCFNWQDPKPLKLRIHLDMLPTVLAAGYTEVELREAMHRYIKRPCYQYALATHTHRVDLYGKPYEEILPEHRPDPASCQAPMLPRLKVARPAEKPTPALTPQDIEELTRMTISARMEVTLKFNELPQAKETPKGAAFALKTEDKTVVVMLPPKAWKKLKQAAVDWPLWMAALSGKIGAPLPAGDGFYLENPALVVFEKKAKPAVDVPAPEAKPAPVVITKKPAPEPVAGARPKLRLTRW